MEKNNIKISIDRNGEVRRESVIEQPAVNVKQPSLLRRIFSANSNRSIIQEELK